MKAAFLFLILGVFAATSATAGELNVVVRDADGAPVKDAVVTFTPAAGVTISAAERDATYVMAQHHIQFDPFVLAVPVGATVTFSNLDHLNHHVYSFSPPQPFQLPLFGFNQMRTVKFLHLGTEALGCNIHDQMRGYIRVVATPYFVKTDAKGEAKLPGVPDGAGALSVWQPMLAAPDNEVTQSVTAGKAAAPIIVAVKIRRMATTSGAY